MQRELQKLRTENLNMNCLTIYKAITEQVLSDKIIVPCTRQDFLHLEY